jgi:mycofactocin precursor
MDTAGAAPSSVDDDKSVEGDPGEDLLEEELLVEEISIDGMCGVY